MTRPSPTKSRPDRGLCRRGRENHVACAVAPALIKVVPRTACNDCLRAWEPTDRAIVFANHCGQHRKLRRLPALNFSVILTTFSMPDRAYLHPIDPELVPGARNAIDVCLRLKPEERIT